MFGLIGVALLLLAMLSGEAPQIGVLLLSGASFCFLIEALFGYLDFRERKKNKRAR